MTRHQDRPGIDWTWVAAGIRDAIADGGDVVGLSSLAVGSDQVFADVVLDTGGRLVAVIPQDDYEKQFPGEELSKYRQLLANAEIVQLSGDDDQQAFLNAGIYIADHCDLLIAIWDGEPAKGKGGTADIVEHARATGLGWIHLEPVGRKVVRHLART